MYLYKYKGIDIKEKAYKYYIYKGAQYIGTFWCSKTSDVIEHVNKLKRNEDKALINPKPID